MTSKLKPKLPIEVVRREKSGKTSYGPNDWKEVVRRGPRNSRSINRSRG